MMQPTHFINRLYDESLSLIVEARNYFQYTASIKASTGRTRHAQAQDRLYANYQAMRLASRMTQAMAWLLAQRAVQSGELSPIEACSGAYSLGGEQICTDVDGHKDQRLPEAMQSLLTRSHSLYMRIYRLDRAAREKYASAEGTDTLQ